MSRLLQVGVSHASASLRRRERLAIGGVDVGPVAARLARADRGREALVLATCSRVEVYAVGADDGRLDLDLLELLARRAGIPFDELAGVADVRHGNDAARHLLRTAAGLESPVLGEAEILGQLRRAHRSAAASGATGPALDQLVARALRAGRRVRSETGLGMGGASLTSSVAMLARELGGTPGARRALVIGRTRTARATAERLLGDGWNVTSGPSIDTAPPLSAFDVVVSCTGGAAAIDSGTLVAAASERAGRPLLVVDLSVPRDVDPAARGVPGVLLHDVDDIAAAARRAAAPRLAHVPAAEAIVEEELRNFESWHATRALVPTIKALREHQRRAVVDVLGDLPHELVERLVTRLLHGPTVRLREAAVSGAGDHWAGTARELFGVNER